MSSPQGGRQDPSRWWIGSHIQPASAVPCAPPAWLGDVALVASHLRTQGLLTTRPEHVRFALRRLGRSDVRDVLAVLVGSAIRGERTLDAFSEAVRPFAVRITGYVRTHTRARSLDPQSPVRRAAR
jgi:hypothetical protein